MKIKFIFILFIFFSCKDIINNGKDATTGTDENTGSNETPVARPGSDGISGTIVPISTGGGTGAGTGTGTSTGTGSGTGGGTGAGTGTGTGAGTGTGTGSGTGGGTGAGTGTGTGSGTGGGTGSGTGGGTGSGTGGGTGAGTGTGTGSGTGGGTGAGTGSGTGGGTGAGTGSGTGGGTGAGTGSGTGGGTGGSPVKLNLLTTSQALGGNVEVDGFGTGDLTGATIALLVNDADLGLDPKYNGDVTSLDTVLGWAGPLLGGGPINLISGSTQITLNETFKGNNLTLSPRVPDIGIELGFQNYGSIIDPKITFKLFSILEEDLMDDMIIVNTTLSNTINNDIARNVVITHIKLFTVGQASTSYSDLYIILCDATDILLDGDSAFILNHFTISNPKVFKLDGTLMLK